MSLVHEMLYQTDNVNAIHCNDYVEQMLGHLFRYYHTGSGTIGYNISAEDIVIELDTAVPFGLMLNELVTNSLKHAFPDNRPGEIVISVKLVDGEKVELVVRDNGIGLPPGLALDQTTSLRLRLVKVLAQQLAATIEIRSETGTEYRITFNGYPKQGRR
jgi:two-component sensor histidine kinase